MGVESRIGVLSSGNGSGTGSGCSSESGSLECSGIGHSAVGSQDKFTNEASLGGEGGGRVVSLRNWAFRMTGVVTGLV